MIKHVLFVILLTLPISSKLIAQSTIISNDQTIANKEDEKIKVPDDFPVYTVTGNLSKDDQTYHIAVKTWISSHSDQYLDLMNREIDILAFRPEYVALHPATEQVKEDKGVMVNDSPNSSKSTYTKADFDAMPQHKRDYIVAHPELFDIK